MFKHFLDWLTAVLSGGTQEPPQVLASPQGVHALTIIGVDVVSKGGSLR